MTAAAPTPKSLKEYIYDSENPAEIEWIVKENKMSDEERNETLMMVRDRPDRCRYYLLFLKYGVSFDFKVCKNCGQEVHFWSMSTSFKQYLKREQKGLIERVEMATALLLPFIKKSIISFTLSTDFCVRKILDMLFHNELK